MHDVLPYTAEVAVTLGFFFFLVFAVFHIYFDLDVFVWRTQQQNDSNKNGLIAAEITRGVAFIVWVSLTSLPLFAV